MPRRIPLKRRRVVSDGSTSETKAQSVERQIKTSLMAPHPMMEMSWAHDLQGRAALRTALEEFDCPKCGKNRWNVHQAHCYGSAGPYTFEAECMGCRSIARREHPTKWELRAVARDLVLHLTPTAERVAQRLMGKE